MSKLIAGKYEILETIGRGGMGTVYKAFQHNLERIVAIKMLSEEMASDPEFRARFKQEAQVVARLSHPNIVAVYDIEPHDSTFCIIMEYVEGKSLQKIIDEGGLPESDVLLIGAQIARALHYAHQRGVVHRDVKPDNILVTADKVSKITDFGIARFRESKLRTQTGISMGTPRFMSPEQVTGKNVDGQSDLYSLGVCLYYALTGQVPFDGESAIAIATRHIYEHPIPPSQVRAAISPAAEKVVMRALEKTKALRFATGEEMAVALEQAAGLSRPIVVVGATASEIPTGATQRIATPASAHSTGQTPLQHTPTGLRRLLETTPSSEFNSTELTPPSPETSHKFEPTKVLATSSQLWLFVQRYWMALAAAALIAVSILIVVRTQRAAELVANPPAPTTPAGSRESDMYRQLAEIEAQAKTLVAEGRAVDARRLVNEFRLNHPQIETSAVESLVDRVNAALPLTEIEELAKRRDEKGKRYYRNPQTLPLARAYLEAARELFIGMQKPYPAEGYLRLLNQENGAGDTPTNEVAAAEAFARAKQWAEKPQSTAEAERAFIEAISLAPGNYAYWLALANFYRSQMFTDDARVLLRYVEVHAPKNSPEYQSASRWLRELEKPGASSSLAN